MVKDTNLPQIIFNKLSKQKYQELRANNQLDPNQFYITPDELDEEKYNIKYSQITNCITKIPQDIKLELNNGTLTLKAGSKVYVPNGKNEDGTNKYIEIILDVDVSRKDFKNNSYSALIIPRYNNGKIDLISYSRIDSAISGTTLPESYTGNFYNITTNYMNAYEAGNLIDTRAFPIGIMTLTNGICTSIDQIFNGFGYIGSTVFALPGVEGLIPNGRNADSSLNNTKIITTIVKTSTTAGTYNFHIQLLSNGNVAFVANYYEQSTPPSNISYTVWYNTEENIKYLGDGTSWVRQDSLDAGTLYVTAGRITSFSPKNTFQAVDRNDTEWLSGWGIPDYSAGISITSYTSSSNQFVAPCDGVLIFTLNISTSGERIYIDDVLIALPSVASSAKLGNTYSFTIGKGQKFYVSPGSFYTAYGINAFFPLKGAK